MLRAYIDDSKQKGIYVLAGYLADATKWAEFADDWDTVLANPPKLHHLKTSDMFRHKDPNSVFYGWTQEETDAKLLELAKTVNKYVLASVQIGIRESDYRDMLSAIGVNHDLNMVYTTLFYSIISGIVTRLNDLKIDDKVEFFFDIQGHDSQDKLREGFREAKEMHQGWLKNRISGEPVFRDDEYVTPLQAADLMAWHFRRTLVESEQGREWKSDVWTELLRPQQITGLLDRGILRALIDGTNDQVW
jgi:hypothetical protein